MCTQCIDFCGKLSMLSTWFDFEDVYTLFLDRIFVRPNKQKCVSRIPGRRMCKHNTYINI
jgi:hypothetical protein